MENKIRPNARKQDLVLQEFVDELLIYDLREDKAYCLNQSSMLIWQLCDGTKTVSEIAAALSKQLKIDISEDFVWLAIDQLSKDNLLEDKSVLHAPGISRRAVVKKLGIASAIALPLVSGIAAPVAAQMGSCLPPGSPCQIATPPMCCDFCFDPTFSNVPGTPGTCSSKE